MVIGAKPGEGASSVSASLALLLASRSANSTWLLDLSLIDNHQFRTFQAKRFPRLGLPGRALDASLKTRQFYKVVPQLKSVDGRTQASQRLLSVHRVENSNLMVTQFRNEFLKPGQKVQIRSSPEYWTALKSVCDWAVIDAPPINTSTAALAVTRYVDGVILVVQADRTQVGEVNALRDEIEAHGGNVLGVVANRVKSDARLADRIVG
tara:strand:+ start:34013 stop:34636 length:624 start_codon:yes stop_codon:yes gene_type:complete